MAPHRSLCSLVLSGSVFLGSFALSGAVVSPQEVSLQDSKRRIEDLIDILQTDDINVKGSALDALKVYGRDAVPIVVSRLKKVVTDGPCDARFKKLLEHLLWDLGSVAVEDVMGMLRVKDARVSDCATDVLAAMREKSYPALVAEFSRSDEYVRRDIVIAAGKMDPRISSPLLMGALGDSHPDVRFTAVRCAARSLVEEAVPSLVRLLSDDDYDVRLAAAESFSFLPSRLAVDGLINLLEAGDKDLKRASLLSLKKIGDPYALDAVLALLGDEYLFLTASSTAKELLGKSRFVTLNYDYRDRVIASIDTALKSSFSAYVIEVLGLISRLDDSAVPRLVCPLLESEAYGVRVAAGRALWELGENPVPDLLERLGCDGKIGDMAEPVLVEIGGVDAVVGVYVKYARRIGADVNVNSLRGRNFLVSGYEPMVKDQYFLDNASDRTIRVGRSDILDCLEKFMNGIDRGVLEVFSTVELQKILAIYFALNDPVSSREIRRVSRSRGVLENLLVSGFVSDGSHGDYSVSVADSVGGIIDMSYDGELSFVPCQTAVSGEGIFSERRGYADRVLVCAATWRLNRVGKSFDGIPAKTGVSPSIFPDQVVLVPFDHGIVDAYYVTSRCSLPLGTFDFKDD